MTTPATASSRPGPLDDAVLAGLAALSRRAEASDTLFAAPIGPSAAGLLLPRYVVFGNAADDDAPRLSLLGGFDRTDSAASALLLDYLGVAADRPDLVGGVVLDTTPLLNRDRDDLWSASWTHSGRPELALLEREFRRLPPHALIAVRTAPADRPAFGELRGLPLDAWFDGASAVLQSIRWAAPAESPFLAGGIAGFTDDLPHRPLEIWLTLPAGDRTDGLVLLHAVVQRIRALLSYAQHL